VHFIYRRSISAVSELGCISKASNCCYGECRSSGNAFDGANLLSAFTLSSVILQTSVKGYSVYIKLSKLVMHLSTYKESQNNTRIMRGQLMRWSPVCESGEQ
jgi:hypothetical protein